MSTRELVLLWPVSTLNVLQMRRVYVLGSKTAVKTLRSFKIIFSFGRTLSIPVKELNGGHRRCTFNF